MGVSVSAAVAIVFSGLLVSATVFFAALDATSTRVIESSEKSQNDLFDREHTAIKINNATYNKTSLTLSLLVTNTGSTALSARGIHIMIDGVLMTHMVDLNNCTIDSIPSDVWAPSTILYFEIQQLWYPYGTHMERIKVLTSNSVSDYTTDIYISNI